MNDSHLGHRLASRIRETIMLGRANTSSEDERIRYAAAYDRVKAVTNPSPGNR